MDYNLVTDVFANSGTVHIAKYWTGTINFSGKTLGQLFGVYVKTKQDINHEHLK